MNAVGQVVVGVVEALATLLTGKKHRLVPAHMVHDFNAEAKIAAAQEKRDARPPAPR